MVGRDPMVEMEADRVVVLKLLLVKTMVPLEKVVQLETIQVGVLECELCYLWDLTS
jgi:hypothetical protein